MEKSINMDGNSSKVPDIIEVHEVESQSIEQLTKNGMQSIMELIKASNNLPIDQWDFFKTFPAFNGLIGPESKKVLEMLNSVLHHQQIHGNIMRRDNDEKFEMIIEANDIILERVDCNLDELQGLRKNPEPIVGQVRAVNRRGMFSLSNNQRNQVVGSLVTTRLNTRPQIKFKDKIDNRNIPFEPRIREKPNALKPLAILIEKYDDRGESFSHPYEYELDLFKPSEDQLQMCTPQPPKPLSEVPLVHVNDLDSLNKMMEHLKKSSEIAVDVEHHSYRSFQGFTCLVQISTRDMDFIVDALELRHELHVLNEVFTDPKIVKVLHGADHDIEWLQRDLSVYIVNMFDTHQAAQLLNLARLSLAYLLKMFCNIDSNKQFQLYDWRTRPLPEDAIKYAREDTHYLLYVYDKLKNALIEKCQNKSNLLESVINKSTEICKKKYWKEILTDNSHLAFYQRSKKMFDNRQMYALKHLYGWRNKIAREEDESVMYVLPNHMLLNIAESLPREVQGISALCNPVPPLVKQHEREIHKIILKAREQSLVKPIVEGDVLNQSLEMQPNWVPVNVDSKLYCPHDLSHCDDDVRGDLPVLLQQNSNVLSSVLALNNNKFGTKTTPVIDIICQSDNVDWNASLLKGKERQWKFVSPYQRYQKVIAFVHSEESKAKDDELKSPNESMKTEVDVDGPSPAKIARVAGSEERKSTDVILKEGDEIKSKVDDNSVKESVTTVDSSSDDNDNVKKKKKKKRKDYDNKINDGSSTASVNVGIEAELETSTVSVASMETNDVSNPDLVEEGEIVDDISVVNEQNVMNEGIVITTNRINRKKKLNDKSAKESQINKKKAKKKDDFQPYNYNEFDFSKFQSSTPQQKLKKSSDSSKKLPQARRTPWLGNSKIRKTLNDLKK